MTGSVQASSCVQSSSAGHLTIRICEPPSIALSFANET